MRPVATHQTQLATDRLAGSGLNVQTYTAMPDEDVDTVAARASRQPLTRTVADRSRGVRGLGAIPCGR